LSWLRRNLFSGWANTLLTLFILFQPIIDGYGITEITSKTICLFDGQVIYGLLSDIGQQFVEHFAPVLLGSRLRYLEYSHNNETVFRTIIIKQL